MSVESDTDLAKRSWRPADAVATLSAAGLASTWRHSIKDALAGCVGAVVLIGNVVSFGALMFPGALSSGIPFAIWAMLIGGGIGGICIALMTSLPPLASSIDSPTGAALVLISASVGPGVLASGGTPHLAIETVMIVFTAATLLSGAFLYALGLARLGAYFRFVPYFVVGGFMAATGGLLIAGGIRMAIGKPPTLANLAAPLTTIQGANLVAACAVLAIVLGVRRWIKWAYAMPFALVGMWGIGTVVLALLGLSGPSNGFYLPSLGALTRWSPFVAARDVHFNGSMAAVLPQVAALAIVALISLVTKVSSIEVARQQSGDLDSEFRAHGLASLIAAPFGGIASGLQVGTSRLLEQAGGVTRASGVFCGLTLGAVGLSSFDLPGVIPIPIIAGLVFSLGHTFIADAFGRPYKQRAWFDLILVLAMMVVCIQNGFLTGVGIGLVVACVLFAVSYARRGVVRRHVTRTEFASNVDRSTVAASYLVENGAAIQLYWLSGYIFFGSSEGMFERIRRDIDPAGPHRVKYVVLDFGTVTGADTSAIVSFTKLRNFCVKRAITLVYCALPPATRGALENGGLLGGRSKDKAFVDLPQGLSWCEDELIRHAPLGFDVAGAGFGSWLQDELGSGIEVGDLLAYLDRTDVPVSQILYREGEPADTIDLVAAGILAVDIAKNDGTTLRVRRIMTYSIVGEMGFFRQTMRSATVSSEGPATFYTMTRPNLQRMRRERPDIACAFDDFILHRLADRVEFANRAIAALSA